MGNRRKNRKTKKNSKTSTPESSAGHLSGCSSEPNIHTSRSDAETPQLRRSSSEGNDDHTKALVYMPLSDAANVDVRSDLRTVYRHFEECEAHDHPLAQGIVQPSTSSAYPEEDEGSRSPDVAFVVFGIAPEVLSCRSEPRPSKMDEDDEDVLVRKVKRLSASPPSKSPRKPSPDESQQPKNRFRYTPEVIKKMMASDASGCSSRGSSSHYAPEAGKGKPRTQANFRAEPGKPNPPRKKPPVDYRDVAFGRFTDETRRFLDGRHKSREESPYFELLVFPEHRSMTSMSRGLDAPPVLPPRRRPGDDGQLYPPPPVPPKPRYGFRRRDLSAPRTGQQPPDCGRQTRSSSSSRAETLLSQRQGFPDIWPTFDAPPPPDSSGSSAESPIAGPSFGFPTPKSKGPKATSKKAGPSDAPPPPKSAEASAESKVAGPSLAFPSLKMKEPSSKSKKADPSDAPPPPDSTGSSEEPQIARPPLALPTPKSKGPKTKSKKAGPSDAPPPPKLAEASAESKVAGSSFVFPSLKLKGLGTKLKKADPSESSSPPKSTEASAESKVAGPSFSFPSLKLKGFGAKLKKADSSDASPPPPQSAEAEAESQEAGPSNARHWLVGTSPCGVWEDKPPDQPAGEARSAEAVVPSQRGVLCAFFRDTLYPRPANSRSLFSYLHWDPLTLAITEFFRVLFVDHIVEGWHNFVNNYRILMAEQIRDPSYPCARFICIVGMNLWVVLRNPSGDFWFFCGRYCCGQDSSDTDARARTGDLLPDQSMLVAAFHSRLLAGRGTVSSPPSPSRSRSRTREMCPHRKSRSESRPRRGRRREEPNRVFSRTLDDLSRWLSVLETNVPGMQPQTSRSAGSSPQRGPSPALTYKRLLAAEQAEDAAGGSGAKGDETGGNLKSPLPMETDTDAKEDETGTNSKSPLPMDVETESKKDPPKKNKKKSKKRH